MHRMQLTVEAPSGVSATAPDPIASDKIVVTGPGVKKEFELTKPAGIAAPGTDSADAVPVDYFTPDGRSVDPAAATDGIYIVKYSDGSVRKLCR